MAQSKMEATIDYKTWKPLLIFFDIETTGPSPISDNIIEIGAVATLISPSQIKISEPTFSRLIKPPRRISYSAFSVHGVSDEALTNEKIFNKVFPQFLKWMTAVIADVTQKMRVNHYPVLAAHNGYNFDFPCLFSEMIRHEMDYNLLNKNQVHFFDTLHHLKELKKESSYKTLDDLKLGLQSLYEAYFPDEEYEGHRALADAEHTARIFMETEVRSSLSLLIEISFDEMEEHWMDMVIRTDLRNRYKVKPWQEKRLAELGFTCEHLEEMFIECQHDTEEFKAILLKKGIYSEALREKLATMLLDQVEAQFSFS